MKASEKIYEVREKTATLFHLQNPENVVFTANATYALNMAIKSKIQSFCHVLISDIEHNAVFRPIEKLKKAGKIDYSVFSVGNDTKNEIEKRITKNTKYIVTSLASNISGYRVPLSVLSDIRKKYGICVIADASQIAGHEDLDLSKYPVDVLCAPAHKGLFGIQGCGFAVFSDSGELGTWIEGGSGNESKNPEMPLALPERLEGGTLSTPAIMTLGAGIDFVRSVGIETIGRKLDELTSYCVNKMREIDDLSVLYPAGNGIVSFLYPPFSAEEIAEYLNRYEICVRAGFHCAPLAHKKLGTYETGCVRVSFSYFNNKSDVDRLIEKLKKIKSK